VRFLDLAAGAVYDQGDPFKSKEGRNPLEASAKPQHDVVTVSFNGQDQELQYNPEAAIQAAVEHAIKLFNITSQPHLLWFFRADGTELPQEGSMKAAGVKPGDVLYLRQSTVRGG
jgi:hypothetical protein